MLSLSSYPISSISSLSIFNNISEEENIILGDLSETHRRSTCLIQSLRIYFELQTILVFAKIIHLENLISKYFQQSLNLNCLYRDESFFLNMCSCLFSWTCVHVYFPEHVVMFINSWRNLIKIWKIHWYSKKWLSL